MKLKISEFDDVIRHIENRGYNSAIILLKAMKKNAQEDFAKLKEEEN